MASDGPAGRVLIVDDDADVGQTVADILTSAGYEVETTRGAQAALELAGRTAFQAAVVDFAMPDMNGLDLTERLREVRPHLQVILFTGHGDVDLAVRALRTEVFDFLQKSQFDVARLEGAVRSAVARSRLLRENQDLLDQLRRSQRLLEALAEVSVERAGARSLESFLGHLVEAAKRLCGASAARVVLMARTQTEGGLVVEWSAGDGADSTRGVRLHGGEGLAALAVENQESFRLVRASEHAGYRQRCDDLGSERTGFMCVPLRHGSVLGALSVAGHAAGSFGRQDLESLQRLASQAAVGVENVVSNERAANFFTHACDILVSILDLVDGDSAGHSRTTALLSDMLTRRLGLDDASRRTIHFGALLHDVGKLRLDPRLLGSTGPLNADERSSLERHPLAAVELLRPIALWSDVLPIIQAHHERWDGKGYPFGLAGEDIPLGARIVAVAEAFDAMTRSRGHAPARTPAEAMRELTACAGSQFDPLLVRLFVAEYERSAEQLPPA